MRDEVTCGLCGRSFKGERGLRAHVAVIHIEGVTDDPYACGNTRTYRDQGCRCADCTAAYNDSLSRNKGRPTPSPSLGDMRIQPKPEWDKALTLQDIMKARGYDVND